MTRNTKSDIANYHISQIARELGKHGNVSRCAPGTVALPNDRRFCPVPLGYADIIFTRPDGVTCYIEVSEKPAKQTDKRNIFVGKKDGHNCRAGIAYSLKDAAAICGIELNASP
jgi:hypothetical protein